MLSGSGSKTKLSGQRATPASMGLFAIVSYKAAFDASIYQAQNVTKLGFCLVGERCAMGCLAAIAG